MATYLTDLYRTSSYFDGLNSGQNHDRRLGRRFTKFLLGSSSFTDSNLSFILSQWRIKSYTLTSSVIPTGLTLTKFTFGALGNTLPWKINKSLFTKTKIKPLKGVALPPSLYTVQNIFQDFVVVLVVFIIFNNKYIFLKHFIL